MPLIFCSQEIQDISLLTEFERLAVQIPIVVIGFSKPEENMHNLTIMSS